MADNIEMTTRELGSFARLSSGLLGSPRTTASRMLPKLKSEDVKAAGSIRIVLHRAIAKKLDVPIYYAGIKDFIPDALSEKVRKELDVKNNIRVSNGEPCDGPGALTHNYLPLPGRPEILQNLGCIPRSSSPQPDPILMLERTKDVLKLAKKRQRESNLMILQLQEKFERVSSGSRDSSFKPESLDGSTVIEGRSRSANVDLTGSGIKKELDEDAVDPLVANHRIQRTRPTPPLFSATATNKRAREEEHDGKSAVVKRARLAAETPVPSVGGQAAGKRKGVERGANKDDLVEPPPQPKRARIIEVVGLTDNCAWIYVKAVSKEM